MQSIARNDEIKSISPSQSQTKSQQLAAKFGMLPSAKKETSTKNLADKFKITPSTEKIKPEKLEKSQNLANKFGISKTAKDTRNLASKFGITKKPEEVSKNSKVLASKFGITVPEENIMTDVTDILLSDASQDTKIASLVKSYGLSFISNWLSSNLKPVLWNIAYTAAFTIAVACAYVFLTSGSWLVLLGVLKQLGTTAVPSILLDAIKKTGLDIGVGTTTTQLLNLAKKNKAIRNILEKQVPQGYLKKVLTSLGCDPTNLKIESVLSNIVNKSIIVAGNIYTGTTLQDFLFTQTLSYIPTVASGGYNIVKSAVSKVSNLKSNIDIISMSGSPTAQNIIIEEIIKTETIVNENIVKHATSQPVPVVSEALNSNVKMAFAGTTAVTVVSLALAGNVDGVVDIVKNLTGTIIETGALGSINSIIKESDFAKSVIAKVVMNRLQLDKLIEGFADKLTSNDKDKIIKWSDALKTGDHENLTSKILRKLTGGEYLTAKTLKSMSTTALIQKYKKLNPDKSIDSIRKISPENLRQLIYAEQIQRQQKLASLVSSFISTTLKTAVVTSAVQATKAVYANIDQINKELELVEKQMAAQALKEASKFETTTEDASTIKETSKLQAQARKAEFKEARAKALLQEGMKIREKSLSDAETLKEAGKLEAQSLKTKFKEAQAAQALKNEEIKAAELSHRMEKLQQIAEKHKLKEAAHLEELARTLGVIIGDENGIAHGLPPEDILLNPQLQKSLDFEFTPIAQKIALETAKASTSWLPGIGWIQSTINQVNLNLDIAEQLNNIKNVVDVVTSLNAGQAVENLSENQQTLKNLLKMRIPSISDAVEQIIKTDKLSAKHVVLQALKDKILFGWDDKTTAREISKKILGTGDYGQGIAEMIGDSFIKMLF